MVLPTIGNFGSWAGLTAIGAALVTSWRYLADCGRYVTGIVIGRVAVSDDASDAVLAFSLSKALRSPLGTRVFGGYETYVHPKRWIETVCWEGMSTDVVLVRYKRSYLLVSFVRHDREQPIIDQTRSESIPIMIRYLRGTFNVEEFLLEAIEYFNTEKRNAKNSNPKAENSRRRFSIRRIGSGGHEKNDVSTSDLDQASPVRGESGRSHAHERVDRMLATGMARLLRWKRNDLQLQPEDGHSPFTGYPFPAHVSAAIRELKCWLSHEKWFRSKAIPWRRGWLIYGKPGTGKSTLVRALGLTFDLPVFVFDLNGMTNDSLVRHWETMLSNTPCITLIEDIDAIFKGREYIGATSTMSNHLTFDCLLNCISGVKQADGVFLVVTTNHLEHLDPALGVPDATGKSSRPGRIDRTIRLDEMEEPERRMLAQHILSEYPELVDQAIVDGAGETAAQFQSRCATLAISRFWKEKL